MKRRTCLQLAPAAILGLGRGNAAETVRLTAGPFSVSVPSEWEATAVIEKVPFHLEGPKLGFTDRPQHWALRFSAAILPRKDIGKDVNLAPQILIHKAEEWSTRFSPEIPGHDRIERLRAELDAGIAGAFPRNYPGFGDGALNFISVKKELAFQGGKGLRIVCESKYDNDFVRREGLMYLFCGLSDDNTCQVLALFPLDHPDLPTRSQKEHLGRRLGPDGELGDEFLSYQADAIQWLEALSNGFSPSLATLDGVVESLSVRHWE